MTGSPNDPKALMLAGGTSFACALLEDGSVRCWGSNAAGAVGCGSSIGPECMYESPTGGVYSPSLLRGPVNMTGSEALVSAVSITAGFNHACAILVDGSVRCWGYNLYG